MAATDVAPDHDTRSEHKATHGFVSVTMGRYAEEAAERRLMPEGIREDSDSLFVENVLASAAQHQRQKNAEQTLNRMRARTMNGYWVFQILVGYKYDKVASMANCW